MVSEKRLAAPPYIASRFSRFPPPTGGQGVATMAGRLASIPVTACLGIHISDDSISAAVCGSDPDEVRVVPLGTSGPVVPAAVAAGVDLSLIHI